MPETILALQAVVAVYGFSRVLQGVSLAVERGRIVALLGRNGAGKTTTLRSVMGLVAVPSGSIGFDGVELRGMPTFKIAQLGIGYVPDDRRIFPDLSVERNLAIGARHVPRCAGGYWNLDTVYQLFPPLHEFRTRKGAVLSGGEQNLIADQNFKFARRLAEYAYIVENGIIRHQGAMEEFLEDGETVRKYLAV